MEMFARDDSFLRYGNDTEHPQTIDEWLAEVSKLITKAVK